MTENRMRIADILRRRPLQLLLIVAWLALGTVMIVLRPHWWVWFAAVSYVIAAVYIVAEVLTWRRVMNQKGRPAGQKDQEPPASGGQSGNQA
jgi:energy-converting hydrogenase Eha subunit C